MTYDQFQAKYLGKAVDFDGVAGVQCVDLADQYLKDVFGITGVWVNGAREFYTNFNSYPALVKAFDRIPNTRGLIVQKGDIVIWSGGTWGHVAIGNGEGNKDWFVSLEENTLGKHEKVQLVKHYFSGKSGNDGCNPVAGVLRAKDQAKVLGETEKGTTYEVTAQKGLNIRAGAGTANKVVGLAAYGEKVTVTETQTWGKLADGRGWVCLTGFTKKK